MNRKTKALLHSGFSLIYQIVTIICGFIMPRMLLVFYGSETNGLVSSIAQFLGFISLCECGVGAVVQSALYKPLADGDEIAISKVFISSERFFRKIAYILLIYTLSLMIGYPWITMESFDFAYTALLILIIAISSFAQYYFGMTYRLLLIADQMGFIICGIQTITILLNTICGVMLMRAGASIHAVKLMTALLFLLQPLVTVYIVKKKYRIDRKLTLTEEPIKQKWNGLAQHIASVVLTNTDTVVLTLFSTLNNVSIYAVYYLVVNGVKTIVSSLTNGIQAMFGNMLAKKEMDDLTKSYDNIEWLLHTVVTLVFTLTALLILPFVQVYTADVGDTNYLVPTFACLITLATAAYCIRLPYSIMVLAAGDYKQTQRSAIIESLINIILSVILVARWGLVGVAIGTLCAMVYRTCYLAWYLSKHILFRRLYHFFRHIAVDVLGVVAAILSLKIFSISLELPQITYSAWFSLAVKAGLIVTVAVLLVNLLFYRDKIIGNLRKYVRILTKFRKKGM